MFHRLLLCAASALFVASSVHAIGMGGQPVPTPAELRDAVRFSQDIIAPTGDKGRSRPQLLVLIETRPTADLVDRFAPALRDANTYTAILATYEDALAGETDPRAQSFIRYNLLRTVVERARYLPTTARRAALVRAANLAEALAKDNRSDAAVWEATGDMYTLKDDTTNAVAAYRRMGTNGSAPMASYKTAIAYQRARDWDKAKAAYEAGIRADTSNGPGRSGREARHLLYHGLASLYLAQGRDKEALAPLLLSAQVKTDPAAPYPFQMEVAETLLRRGYAKQVREYADAVLKISPDDEGAKRLLAAMGVSVP